LRKSRISWITFMVAVCAIAPAGVGASGLAAAAATSSPKVVTGGSWTSAIEVPGSAPLNVGGYAVINDISCTAAGYCSAVGAYRNRTRTSRTQAFVVSEVHGRWGSALEVPGSAALNVGEFAQVNAVSCASPGNCAAAGGYTDGSGHYIAFVVSQVHGTWGVATTVKGLASLAATTSSIKTVSCPTPGSCTAGGHYVDGSAHGQAFVVNEVAGVWGAAQEVPGTASLNIDGAAGVSSVSCSTAGSCSAGGSYKDGSARVETFVVDEVGGTWGSAVEAPGINALNADDVAGFSSMSCASSGNCSAVGSYVDSKARTQSWVMDEVSGTWEPSRAAPGLEALNAGGYARATTVSCRTAGNCAAGGLYRDSSHRTQAFLINEVGGVWGHALEVPGTAALNLGGGGQGVYQVSCASPGTCSAVGDFDDSAKHGQAFVANEVGGTWGAARVLPGSQAMNSGGDAQANSVSCTSSGACATGGNYEKASGRYEVFVADFWPTPVARKVAPSAGPTRGRAATIIFGTHFAGATAVLFGSRHALQFTVVNGSAIRAVAPAGVGTVLVRVVTPGGTSLVNGHDKYTYMGMPSITAITPARGPASGGTRVEIIGTGLTGVTAVLVGSRLATHIVMVNAHVLRVSVPPGEGRVDLRVRTSGGTSARTSRDWFTYRA